VAFIFADSCKPTPVVRSSRGGEVRAKVLIVDDDAAIRQQLFWTLCDEFDVTTAHDLSTAVRRATIYEPEISILDLHLPPALDTPEVGLRVLEFIKARSPASKVFVVSSDAGTETRKACVRAGADVVLPKPLDVEQLLAEVRRTSVASRLASA
jgi:DNA-binding response OmpR family regulator